MHERDLHIVGPDDLLLVTGASGFIGPRVVESLIRRGFRRVRCLVRPFSDVTALEALAGACRHGMRVEIVRGNLLSTSDCVAATRDAPAAAWTEKPPAIVRLCAVDLNILLYGQAVGELNVP